MLSSNLSLRDISLTLLFLFLVSLPVHASGPTNSKDERRAAVDNAVGWLHTQQADDGSVGGLGMSCDVAKVVALAGENPDGLEWTPTTTSLLDKCEADVPIYLARRDAGRIAKVLRATVAAGVDPRSFGGLELIAELEAQYDAASGLYHPTHFFQHNLVVLALREAGRTIPDDVISAMLEQQRPDGSWGWPVDPTPGDGSPATGDTDSTGQTLQALRAAGLAQGNAATAKAVNHLIEIQNLDAGWGAGSDSDSNSDSTSLAIAGLLFADANPEAAPFVQDGQTAVQALLNYQEASGAFIYKADAEGNPMLATLDAIPTLLETYPDDIPKPLFFYMPIIMTN